MFKNETLCRDTKIFGKPAAQVTKIRGAPQLNVRILKIVPQRTFCDAIPNQPNRKT